MHSVIRGRSRLGVLVALVAGGVLGFWGRGFMSGRRGIDASVANNQLANAAAPDVRRLSRGRLSGEAENPTSTRQTPYDSSDENASPDAEARCRQLFAAPATPARDQALAAAIERLARTDPQRALSLVEQCANQRLRTVLFDAVFRGWGATDPRSAADWILAQTNASFDPDAAVTSLLKGAAVMPATAMQVTLRLCEQNPDAARDYGDALIYALGQNGAFGTAAAFAAHAPGDLRTEWLAAAYGNWTNSQPDAAAASAAALPDAEARHAALDAVIASWGTVNPQALADFAATNLPAGEQKNRALTNALVRWSVSDPVGAAQWMNRFGASPDLDAGAAALATQPDVMKQPATALHWAQAVTDPNLRSRTVAAILQTWALSDPAAAAHFAQTTLDLLPADRSAALQGFAPAN